MYYTLGFTMSISKYYSYISVAKSKVDKIGEIFTVTVTFRQFPNTTVFAVRIKYSYVRRPSESFVNIVPTLAITLICLASLIHVAVLVQCRLFVLAPLIITKNFVIFEVLQLVHSSSHK